MSKIVQGLIGVSVLLNIGAFALYGNTIIGKAIEFLASKACDSRYITKEDYETSKVSHIICDQYHICSLDALVKLNKSMARSYEHLQNKSQLDEIDRFEANEAASPQKPAPIIIRGEGGK
jgi:hypothetical protein